DPVEPELQGQDHAAGPPRTRARWRRQHRQRISESPQRRPVVPQHVDAGDGQRNSCRRDGAADQSRGRRRHRGRAARRRDGRDDGAARARDTLMASTKPKTSPAIDKMIEEGLFDRLPVTFSTYSYDQFRDWDLLFPTEKSYYERFFGLLNKTDPRELDRLFEPVREAERQMGVTPAIWPKRTFTLQQVDFLNRSPHYPV